MNENAELLNFVYQNSQMGLESLKELLSLTENQELNKYLEHQLNEYKLINDKALKHLNEHGYDEKGISAFRKVQSYLIINFQTMMDKSPSHIAEMLITGSNMGVIDAIKNIKKYKNAEPNILSLMDELKKFEEKNMEQLKAFL